MLQAQLFVSDFIVTQLIGKNLNEIWIVQNPMSLLEVELKKDGVDIKCLESRFFLFFQGNTKVKHKILLFFYFKRLLWSTGIRHSNAVYVVGLYMNDEQLSIGNGETLDVAEEMAARDALRRIYGTTDNSAPLPYGDKARRFAPIINTLFEKLSNQSSQSVDSVYIRNG